MGPLSAQTIRGRLLEVGTDRPISSGTVALLTEEGELVVSTLTGTAGSFEIATSTEGVDTYLLTGQALGYRSSTDGVFRLGPGDTITVEFRIEPAPVLLDSLVVEGRRVEAGSEPDLVRNGFLDRMKGGFGEFLTPADLERLNPPHLAGLFNRIQGVYVNYRFASARLRMRGNRGWCTPRTYVDGFRIRARGNLDNLGLAVRDLKAVEVFRRAAEAPLEYAGTAMDGCGIVLVWTKP